MVRAKSRILINASASQLAQLTETFLSSEHQDYLAVIAEFWSGVRA